MKHFELRASTLLWRAAPFFVGVAFAAQFDRPGQGRTEIFTKPGTDEFHGSLLFQFSDAALNSRNTFVSTKPPYQRRQWEGELSGPIGKKTSFSTDFARPKSET